MKISYSLELLAHLSRQGFFIQESKTNGKSNGTAKRPRGIKLVIIRVIKKNKTVVRFVQHEYKYTMNEVALPILKPSFQQNSREKSEQCRKRQQIFFTDV